MAQFSGALQSYSTHQFIWIDFPASKEDFQEALKKIGNPEEYFFADYEYPIDNMKLEEYANLEHINEIAEFIDNLDNSEQVVFSAILDFRNWEEAVKIFNDQDYQYYDDCNSETDLGYILAENFSIPDHLENYIDYEAIGRDYDQNANGGFTNAGYIEIF